MTQCFLLRHADAGSRGIQNDAQRTLSRRGRTQADALVAQFAGAGITVIRSSPYARCMETVAPLAAASTAVAEPDASLGEGTGAAPTLALIEAATVPTILCSHGDVIGEVMHTIARRGVSLDDDRLAKASTWVITVTDGEITAATYLPPPTCP